MLAHGSEPNMVPAALVILGMILVLPLPLVVTTSARVAKSLALFCAFVVTEPVEFNAPGKKIEIRVPEVGAVSVLDGSQSRSERPFCDPGIVPSSADRDPG
ncbi:hypothetical protein PR003_g22929 [Phytophthora rubi]|uniref:Uncharacterized protein n=1 Tax=Phytophthora rubi TaxID=129364 RepID=A0A6A4DBJ7_9STRA|nr:hypothetical protein PR003_g22929 [Phytophthora rubi]